MKIQSPSFPALALAGAFLAAMPLAAQSAPRYIVNDLGPATDSFSQAVFLNNFDLVTGLTTDSNGVSHAALWYQGMLTDISKPGLGGTNSSAGGINEFGQIIGQAETAAVDPNKENFCGYGTGLQCLSFIWQAGSMTALPTIKGGTNNSFGAINNVGAVAGYSENGVKDSECPTKPAVNGTGPQLQDVIGVVWGPQPGEMRMLPPLPGDSFSMAFGINDLGETVGGSGRCGNSLVPGFAETPHAVLWEPDGAAHDLGNLGGTSNTSILGVSTVAFAINNKGQVAGQAALAGNQAFHPFVWTVETGLRDLGLLSGDFVGASLAINNRGEIVGASVSAPGPATGNPRAFYWRDNQLYDLNSLVQSHAPLYLLTAFSINDSGVIAGFGATSDGDVHGFIAMPAKGDEVPVFDNVLPRRNLKPEARQLLLKHLYR